MNSEPDDPSEIEPPMTRAFFATDLDLEIGQRPDADGTMDDETRRPPTETDLAPARLVHSRPADGSSLAWTSPGTGPRGDGLGTSRRGIVGKIEPDQTLYGKYRVLRKLGSGAMGDVWLVRHVTLKSQHALKMIVPNFASNAVALMRFQREFEVMATLRHEHAVTIYDACIDDDGGYIDMEYVDGLTFHEILGVARSKPDRDPLEPLMPLDWIVRVLDQLCDVLQVAHEKGIVHRDLKPSNMMLLSGRKPGKEYLKVLDFGIAKIRDDPDGAAGRELEESANRTEGFIGTPSYGSPEQALTSDDIDGRADLYSVGIMLYEFVTGRLPFRGSPFQVMTQNASMPPPSFFEANARLRPMPEVEHAILRILSKDREQRPQTARELYDEFRGAVEAVLPPTSPGLTPPSWDAVPAFPRSSNSPRPSHPTEHEVLVGAAPSLALHATLLADASVHEGVGRLPKERLSELGTIIQDRPGPSWLKFSAFVGVACALIVAAGVFAYVFRKVDSKGAGAGSGSVPVAKSPARSFEDYWPEDYLSAEQSGQVWPTRVRRTSDEVYFIKFSDGIYLPEGFTPENRADLLDGWPRVIVRDGVRFIRIQGEKEWVMGDWAAPLGSDEPDTPAHPVILTGYYIQETEVTNGQFDDFLNRLERTKPADWEKAYNVLKQKIKGELARQHPAVNVSGELAIAFAKAMSGMLPTEAQWEYAARSRGEKRRYVWGNSPRPSRRLANIERQDDLTTAPVGTFLQDKTEEGLVDMAGNVRELCRDGWETYKRSTVRVRDPYRFSVQTSSRTKQSNEMEFVVRGAAWNSLPEECSTTLRREPKPLTEVSENLGFRLVIECPDTRKPG